MRLTIEWQHKLVEEHVVLARSLAHRFRGLGVEDDDLLQEALLGLTDAARTYDHSRGVFFFEYARPFALKRIARAIRGSGSIALPARLAETVRDVRRARAQLIAAGNRKPDAEQIRLLTGYQIPDIELVGFKASRPRVKVYRTRLVRVKKEEGLK